MRSKIIKLLAWCCFLFQVIIKAEKSIIRLRNFHLNNLKNIRTRFWNNSQRLLQKIALFRNFIVWPLQGAYNFPHLWGSCFEKWCANGYCMICKTLFSKNWWEPGAMRLFGRSEISVVILYEGGGKYGAGESCFHGKWGGYILKKIVM